MFLGEKSEKNFEFTKKKYNMEALNDERFA